MDSRPKLVLLALLLLVLIATVLADEKVFMPPKAYHAKTYPARDEHPNENVTIAIDPYDMPDKTSGVFSVDYKNAGFLPVRLIISNDGDKPLVLTGMKVEFVTLHKTKIQPATSDDIYRRIAKVQRPDKPRPVPLPIPRKQKPAVSAEAQREIENSRFLAHAVDPHSTAAGFLYFDVSGISNPMAGATLYVSGVTDSSGQELMYFEIPLEKYLSYKPGSSNP